MTTDLFQEHRLLIAAAEDLLDAVRRDPPARVDEIAQMRVRVSNIALAHLRAEDEMIVKPLMATGLVDRIPQAAAIVAEIREGHTTYSDHIRKWTLKAIEADRAGYLVALSDMIDFLHRMTAREERALYWPALKLLQAERSSEAG